jgi:hypothetical protein
MKKYMDRKELCGQSIERYNLNIKCHVCSGYHTTSLFGWLLADGWYWFVLREKYCWLVAGVWFVVREKYCWLVADKPSEQGYIRQIRRHIHI